MIRRRILLAWETRAIVMSSPAISAFPAGGAYSAPPDSLAVFKGAYRGGRRNRGKRKGRETEGEVSGWERREGEGPAPKYFGLELPLCPSSISSICRLVGPQVVQQVELVEIEHHEVVFG